MKYANIILLKFTVAKCAIFLLLSCQVSNTNLKTMHACCTVLSLEWLYNITNNKKKSFTLLDGRRDIPYMIRWLIHAVGQWLCECGYVNWDSATNCGRCGREK